MAGILITCTQLAIGRSIWSFSRLGWFFFASWNLVIPVLMMVGTLAQKTDFNAASTYFRISYALWILFTILPLISTHRIIRHCIDIVLALIAMIFSIPLFLYAGYFWIYGVPFDQMDLLPILHTTQKEALGYVSDQIGWPSIGFAICMVFIYGIFLSYLKRSDTFRSSIPLPRGKRRLCVLVLSVATLWMAGNNLVDSFPIREYRTVRSYEEQTTIFQARHDEVLKHFQLPHPEKSLAHTLPGSVIVVIGESANREHMKAWNPSYPAETTPWMSSLQDKPDFYLYTHAYSNYPQTIPALSMFLTGMNQYNGKSLTETVSILDAARIAGYTTWWISNQTRLGGTETPTTIIAESADETRWTSPAEEADGHLLPFLQDINPEDNNLIFIHLMGSHMRYADRIPADFHPSLPDDMSEKVRSYDTTLAYTDEVLHQIFTYAKAHLHLQAMIYCSDHGEDLTYGHGAGKFTFDMVRIPLFFYVSPTYQHMYPETARYLEMHQNEIFTNDLMYDTLSGLLRIPNSEYSPDGDLTSQDYHLSIERAVTKHGKVPIAEDPLLQN